ncbi:DNA/RNA polymerase [Nadsonia fulvescens var. elongata DSM 6958]|uniref:DNA polymerase eta n=1 Tax=Nadsonia fulvescens var. elongata DSM 6958 TaxID=857566 RepID=A0A1E3PDE0_9ASCO|nr:DNA/RNA polymerase [Nadsonia fulvescens var. elongata DSM 6958]
MKTSAYTFRNLYDLEKKNTSYASPLAVIAHIDLDAFYAQCEQVRLGLKATDPVVCRQWNGLIAIGYGARKYGISRHENVASAKEKCPGIILAHVATFKMGEAHWKYHEDPDSQTHKVSLDPYRRESRRILSIFKNYCNIIEKASIDESFLDLGKLVLQKALELFPELLVNEVGFDMENKLPEPPKLTDFPEQYRCFGNEVIMITTRDTNSIEKSEKGVEAAEVYQKKPDELIESTMPCISLKSENFEACTSDEHLPKNNKNNISKANDDEPLPKDFEIKDWDDVLILLASNLVSSMRQELFNRLGYTCSAGIGRVRTIAKLASGMNKPNKQTVVRNCAIESFMSNFEATDIPGLGGKKGTSIARILNLPNSGSLSILREFSLPELEEKLHDATIAQKLYNSLRGLDYGEINTRVDVKSMQSSKQFRPGIKDHEIAVKWLKVYSGELAVRIGELEEETGTKRRPRVLRINHRQFQPSLIQRSRQMPIPDVPMDKLQDMLFINSCQLLKELEQESLAASYGHITIYPAALLSLGVSNFEGPGENGKKIVDFFSQISDDKLQSNLKKDLEKLPFETASLVTEKQQSRKANPKIGPSKYLSARTETESSLLKKKVDPIEGLDRFFSLGKAEKTAPSERKSGLENESSNNRLFFPCEKCDKSIYIEDIPEHSDWHFAKDMAQKQRLSSPISLLSSPSTFKLPIAKQSSMKNQELGRSGSVKKKVKLEKGQTKLKF